MDGKRQFYKLNVPLKVVLWVFVALFSFAAIFLYKSLDVLLSVFPLDNPEALVFTLTHNVGGAQNIVWTLLEPVVGVSIEQFSIVFLFVGLVALAIALLIYKKKNSPGKKNNLKWFLHITFYSYVIFLFSIGVVTWILAIFKFPVRTFVDAYGPVLLGWSKENVLFDKDYVYPDSVQISFDEKRNLIFVILESMEYNFQDSANGGNVPQNLIPEITDLMKKNVSFEPGGVTVNGTGWTMGETIAKLCGLPLMQPLDKNTYGKNNFLKNASCLTDLLKQNGYSVSIAQGTGIKFASMDYFLSSHNVAEEGIFDIDYFEEKGAKPSDTLFFVSIPDRILYAEIKNLIAELAGSDEPWTLMFYTIDSHGPYGRMDSCCIDEQNPNMKMELQYSTVLRCASRQLDDFLKWASTQPWYEHTTFAIMGDHPAMISPEVAGFPKEKFEHYWLTFFVNSVLPQPKENHQFTSFDIYPTVLEAMGAKIDGRALGLGRSLFSDQRTLLEKYGKDSLNALINRKGDAYNHFWR